MSPPSFGSRSSKPPPGIEQSWGTLEESRWPPEQLGGLSTPGCVCRSFPTSTMGRGPQYAVVCSCFCRSCSHCQSLDCATPGAGRHGLAVVCLRAVHVRGGIRDVAAPLHCPRRRRSRPMYRRVDSVFRVAVASPSWRERAGGCIGGCGSGTLCLYDDGVGALAAVRSVPQPPDPTLDDDPDRRHMVVVRPELTALPPLAHYVDRPAPISLKLAAYARHWRPCPPYGFSSLVQTEIPYFCGRLLARRQFNFPCTWASLAHEQTQRWKRSHAASLRSRSPWPPLWIDLRGSPSGVVGSSSASISRP